MISVFVNNQGFYIKGSRIEIALFCSPKLDDNGELFYPPQCHTYVVLAKALSELKDYDNLSDIIVYNDSRIIDELNGLVSPIDQLSIDLRNSIRRNLLPEIRANVFFRKKNSRHLAEQIDRGRRTMIDIPNKTEILDKVLEKQSQVSKNNSLQAIKKLKEQWKNGIRNK